MLPAVPSLDAVASGDPEYAVANAKGLSASCPAVTESLDSAYLTLNVWICPTGPLVDSFHQVIRWRINGT